MVAEVGDTALFGARFRENAARALLIPRRRPGQRTPLWQQRLKAQSLLQVARKYGSFPIVLETYRECLQDVFDLPALKRLLAGCARALDRLRRRRDRHRLALLGLAPLRLRRHVHVRGRHASRRAAGAGAVARPRPPARAARPGGAARPARPRRDRGGRAAAAPATRATPTSSTTCCGCAATCARRVRRGLRRDARPRAACAPRPHRRRGAPDRGRGRRPLPRRARRDAARRPARGVPRGRRRTRCASSCSATRRAAARSRPPRRTSASAATSSRSCASSSAQELLVRGELRPGGTEREWCDPDVLRRLRRASLAALRREVEPVEQATLGRFLPSWHGIDRRATLREALVPLQALPLPGRAVGDRGAAPPRARLRARAARPALRDRRGRLGRRGARPRRAVLPRGRARARSRPGHAAARRARSPSGSAPRWRGGAQFWLDLLAETGLEAEEALPALWELVWAGEVTNDAWTPLRAGRRYGVPKPRAARRAASRAGARRAVTATQGRWSLTERLFPGAARPPRARRAAARAAGHRHARRRPRGGHPRRLRRGLRRAEGAGDARRSAAAATSSRGSAARSSRSAARSSGCASCGRARARRPEPLVLAAADPAQPYGAALPWPKRAGARAARVAGAHVVLLGGEAGALRRARRQARSSRCATPTTSGCARRSPPSSSTSARAARSGSRSSASTASPSTRPRSCRCSSRPASSPARAAPSCAREAAALAGRRQLPRLRGRRDASGAATWPAVSRSRRRAGAESAACSARSPLLRSATGRADGPRRTRLTVTRRGRPGRARSPRSSGLRARENLPTAIGWASLACSEVRSSDVDSTERRRRPRRDPRKAPVRLRGRARRAAVRGSATSSGSTQAQPSGLRWSPLARAARRRRSLSSARRGEPAEHDAEHGVAPGRLRERARVREQRRHALLAARRVVPVDETTRAGRAPTCSASAIPSASRARLDASRARAASSKARPNAAPLAACRAKPSGRQAGPRVTALPSTRHVRVVAAEEAPVERLEQRPRRSPRPRRPRPPRTRAHAPSASRSARDRACAGRRPRSGAEPRARARHAAAPPTTSSAPRRVGAGSERCELRRAAPRARAS